jgi:hypothetical protein
LCIAFTGGGLLALAQRQSRQCLRTPAGAAIPVTADSSLGFCVFDASGTVDGQHFSKGDAKYAPEIVEPLGVIPLPKLSVQRQPRNSLRSFGGNSVKALSEPIVNVERECIVRERRDVRFV